MKSKQIEKLPVELREKAIRLAKDYPLIKIKFKDQKWMLYGALDGCTCKLCVEKFYLN